MSFITTVAKLIIGLFYRLTVGLTVLLLKTGLLYLIFFLAIIGWILSVWLVTWKTYTATERHLGWTTFACGLTVLLYGGVVVLLHHVAKDKLGLTALSLPQLFSVMFLGRRPPADRPQACGGGGGGDGRRDTGRPGGGEEQMQVKVRRKVTIIEGHSSSSSSVQTRTAQFVQT